MVGCLFASDFRERCWRWLLEIVALRKFSGALPRAGCDSKVMTQPTPTFSKANPTPTRVLVAEDDEQTRTALAFLLQRHGYAVTVANDGQAALETLLAPDPPHVALLDWEMPRLDGLHVCRAVRAIPANRYTYIIMVTARDQAKDVLAAFATGVDDFLSKPVDSAQLLARLRSSERVLALEERYAQRIAELEKALEEVRRLKRLLPMCMYCKKIRDDGDYWHEIEAYIREQTGTDFSHSICPGCMDSMLKRDLPDDPVARAERNSE